MAVYFLDTIADCREAAKAITKRLVAKQEELLRDMPTTPIALAIQGKVDRGDISEDDLALFTAVAKATEGYTGTFRKRRTDRPLYAGQKLAMLVALNARNGHNYGINTPVAFLQGQYCISAAGIVGNNFPQASTDWRFATEAEIDSFFDALESGRAEARTAFLGHFNGG